MQPINIQYNHQTQQKYVIISNLLANWSSFEENMKYVNNWENFYNILVNYNLSNIQRNDLFKKICKYILLYHPLLRYNFIEIYFFHEIPQHLIGNNKFDILAKTNNGDFIPIQCIFNENNKYVSNRNIYSHILSHGIIITNTKVTNSVNIHNKNYVIDNLFFDNNMSNDDFIKMGYNIVVPMDVE